MNTDLDGPLAVWGGGIMLAVGIFGWTCVPLYFIGIDLLGIQHEGTVGLGSIIGAVFGGIGGAFVFKSHQYKKIKKKRLTSPCQAVRTTGHHDYIDLRDEIKREETYFNVPKNCKSCGHTTIDQYTYFGEKK